MKGGRKPEYPERTLGDPYSLIPWSHIFLSRAGIEPAIFGIGNQRLSTALRAKRARGSFAKQPQCVDQSTLSDRQIDGQTYEEIERDLEIVVAFVVLFQKYAPYDYPAF